MEISFEPEAVVFVLAEGGGRMRLGVSVPATVHVATQQADTTLRFTGSAERQDDPCPPEQNPQVRFPTSRPTR